MSEFRLIDLPAFSDARGQLVVLEKAMPFAVKRLFWISASRVRGWIFGLSGHLDFLAIGGLVVLMNY